MTAKCALPVLALATIATGWSVGNIRPIVNPATHNDHLDVHEDHAAASLVGQFRTSVSAWLYLRTDVYLHNGTEMRPLTDGEKRSGVKIQAPKAGEELRQEAEITVVPPQERDFRGIFGDVEREVAAFKDMHGHTHNEPRQTLPLFRLMTWLDPQFIQGWTMGASVFARDRSDRGTEQALEFLREGLKANPDSVDILAQVGATLVSRKRPLVEAIPVFQQAHAVGLKRFDSLDDKERDALNQAYRWLALCYRDTGRADLQRAIILEGAKLFTDDPLLQEWAQKLR